MRPSDLDPFFAPVSSRPGIGPKLADMIARVCGRDSAADTRVVDLLLLAPHSIVDRRQRPGIASSPEGAIVTLDVVIDRHQPPSGGGSGSPYRVMAHDGSGEIALTFFRARRSWLENALPVGETMIVSGRVEWFNGRASMVHPDHMVRQSDAASLPLVEPVYPLTAGLSARVLRRALDEALQTLPDLPEWIETSLRTRQGFSDFSGALRALHAPRDAGDLDARAPARRRLAYDELLAGQLSLALVRQKVRKLAGAPVNGDGLLRNAVTDHLPFALTGDQTAAIADILDDMARPQRMLRLLQGDVGSGKTVVALMAMLAAAEAGGQAVLMAPTEILARQHRDSIETMTKAAGVGVEILTGRANSRERARALERIASGEARIILGTHALFQESVTFDNLLLAVVDEQHRFGVHQRLRLTAKGTAPHMLVMTATPIPRTLVLAAFGDMDVSRLTEKPAGRKPIRTVILPDERIGDIVERLRAALADGRKAYWVCPLVEDSGDAGLVSAEGRHAVLAQVFGARVGLVHGRMSGPQKDAAMLAFRNGDLRILVATTVIEVGVDVPDASIIVIEHAERFGLAQLHQLRGRVGRGEDASSCILLYKAPLGDTAHARLAIMRDSEDGFRIAEEDLKLRGEGELLGTRQSGTPGFVLASLEAHGDLLQIARDDARYVMETDPDLSSPRGRALRMLLYLFRRDEAIRLLRAG